MGGCVLLYGAYIVALWVIGSKKGGIFCMWKEFQLSCRLYIHIWVDGDSVNLDMFTDEMTEWNGGRCCVLPNALLLCWGKAGVLVGGGSDGDDVVVCLVGFHESQPSALIGVMQPTFRFFCRVPGDIEERAFGVCDGGKMGWGIRGRVMVGVDDLRRGVSL